MKIVKNDLFDYENRYIFQLESSYKFSIDSILLAEYVKVKNVNAKIVDLCTGLAPIPLILSTKYKNFIKGIEIQKEVYDVSLESLKVNNLENQIKIINDDVNNLEKYVSINSIDIITCNPPFFPVSNSTHVNEDLITKLSRHEYLLKLEDIFKICSEFLKNKGELYLVHRPQRFDEIVLLGNKYNVRVREVNYITTNKKNDIKIILVKCIKNSGFGIKTNVTSIYGIDSYKGLFEGVKK